MKKVIWFLFLMALFFVPSTVVFAQGEQPPIVIGEVSAARVITFIAAAMTLLFDYFPWLSVKYDALTTSAKQLWAVGSAFVIVGVAFGLTCANVVSSSLSCTPTGAWKSLSGVIYLIIVQYSLHKATKPTQKVKTAIANIGR